MNQNALTPIADPSVERSRRTVALILAVAALTIPAACYSGVVLSRWGDAPDLQNYLVVLDHLPNQLGDWRFVDDGTPISEAVSRKLQVRGYVHRIYEHPATGQRAALLLLVGPAGPLVRHPPEICYETGANDLLDRQLLTVEAGGQTDHLRLLTYRSASLVDGDFLVAYGFGSDRHWDCPKSPRLAYGGKLVLYKLQVLSETAAASSASASDGLKDFLTHLLPVLNAAMEGETENSAT